MRGPKAEGSGNSCQVEERGDRRRVLRFDRGITFRNQLRALTTSAVEVAYAAIYAFSLYRWLNRLWIGRPMME
jgi:hypothetical protein